MIGVREAFDVKADQQLHGGRGVAADQGHAEFLEGGGGSGHDLEQRFFPLGVGAVLG